MVKSAFPFDTAQTFELQWRQMGKFWMRSGPIYASQAAGLEKNQALQPFGDGGGRNVKVRAGTCWNLGHCYVNDAQETVTIAANGSGNPRIDRIVVRLDMTANTVDTFVIQGTPAASPNIPPLVETATVNDVPICYVAVANGATVINAGDVTDERSLSVPAGFSVGAEATIPSATVTELTDHAIGFTAEAFDTCALHDTATNPSRLTIPAGMGGIWTITGWAEWGGGVAAGDRYLLGIMKNGSDFITAVRQGASNIIVGGDAMSVSVTASLAGGEYVELIGRFENASTATTRTIPDGSFSIAYQGRS